MYLIPAIILACAPRCLDLIISWICLVNIAAKHFFTLLIWVYIATAACCFVHHPPARLLPRVLLLFSPTERKSQSCDSKALSLRAAASLVWTSPSPQSSSAPAVVFVARVCGIFTLWVVPAPFHTSLANQRVRDRAQRSSLARTTAPTSNVSHKQ